MSEATSTPDNVTQLRSLDDLVNELLDLQEQAAAIDEMTKIVKGQLADRIGVGNKHEALGMVVSVREPSRKFDIDAALALLTDEQKALALTPDAATVKSFLPPDTRATVMKPGTGKPVVTLARAAS